jgi:diguanylate cyclase (GGDEF)-like protein/PAS domain S-box-containing protein
MKHRCLQSFITRSFSGGAAWLLCIAIGIFTQISYAQPADRPKSIRVVMHDGYPPYLFRSQDGQLQGILKDKWDLWSRKTGVKVHIEATDWNVAEKIMHNGGADVIDTAFRTKELEKWLDFSYPHETLKTIIFFNKTIGGVQNVNDLRGYVVGVSDDGEAAEELVLMGFTNLIKYPNYESIIKAAAKGEINVFCMEKIPAFYFLQKSGQENNFRHIGKLYSRKFRWATRKGNSSLHRIVEEGFDRISRDERKAIEDKWKGISLEGRPEVRYTQYILYALLMVGGFAAVFVLLSWYLRRKVVLRTAELSTTVDALRTSERYNRMLFESTAVGLRLCKLDGSIVDANQAFADIIGYTVSETIHLTLEKITAPGYKLQDQQNMETLTATGEYGPINKEYLKKSGEKVSVRVMGTLIERAGERYILSSVEDITEQKATEEQINFLAFHDPLTSLPNRMYAHERFVQARANADRDKSKVALLLLDLDNFKNINDSLGHVIGDALLKAVATRLRNYLANSVTISRQGGDEFLVTYPGLRDADAVEKILTNLMLKMQEPFDIEGNELTTSVSVGAAIYPDDGSDFETLMRNADIAMYQAKYSGRNVFCFFDEEMHTKAFERLNLGSGLRRAQERNELLLHYQPLIDLKSGKVIGAEALLRWNHPELGLVLPERFVALAEDTGLIVPIGDWVLQEACHQAAVWQSRKTPDFRIAINLSAAQFRRHDLEKSVKRALELSKINPAFVELELTETILMTSAENALESVQRLESLGVKLSIDDFGTGYSSLSYLKRFAVNKLKIDRSFVHNVTTDSDDAAIVRAIIQMAKSLGLKTIAEGVEESSTLDWLRQHECDEAQGYYFAKPMNAEQFTKYLATFKPTKID